MLNFASCEYASVSYKILCSGRGGGGGGVWENKQKYLKLMVCAPCGSAGIPPWIILKKKLPLRLVWKLADYPTLVFKITPLGTKISVVICWILLVMSIPVYHTRFYAPGQGGGVLNFASCEYQGFICWEWALFWCTHHGVWGHTPSNFFWKVAIKYLSRGRLLSYRSGNDSGRKWFPKMEVSRMGNAASFYQARLFPRTSR